MEKYIQSLTDGFKVPLREYHGSAQNANERVYFYPFVRLTRLQRELISSGNFEQMLATWNGVAKYDPYCERADDAWRQIVKAYVVDGNLVASKISVKVAIPDPDNFQISERIVLPGDFVVLIKDRNHVLHTGLVSVYGTLYICSGVYDDSSGPFVLLARKSALRFSKELLEKLGI